MVRNFKTLFAGVATVALMLGVSASATAQSMSGEAFGALVTAPGGSQAKTPRAAVSSGNEFAEASVDRLDVSGMLSSNLMTSVATGASSAPRSGAQSVATVADVTILNGLITASRVIAVASSTRDGGMSVSDANGSTFEALMVNGSSIAKDGAVAPNTRIALPGVGYVVLNEQVVSRSGSRSSITVNMIHVVLENALTGARTGEIIVGSASSSVN